MKQAVFLIQIGFILLILAIVFRLADFHNANLIPVINTSPGAIHRLADTILLGGIGLALLQIYHVLKGRSLDSSGGAKQKESEDKE